MLQFPTDICRLLESNNTMLKNAILENDFAFGLNRERELNEDIINVTISIKDKITTFENFFYLLTKRGSIPFQWLDLKWSDFYDGDHIYQFVNGFKSEHQGLDNYKITFQLKVIQ